MPIFNKLEWSNSTPFGCGRIWLILSIHLQKVKPNSTTVELSEFKLNRYIDRYMIYLIDLNVFFIFL